MNRQRTVLVFCRADGSVYEVILVDNLNVSAVDYRVIRDHHDLTDAIQDQADTFFNTGRESVWQS